ncbi:TPA: type-F conjugative transfer system pilin acetylase TraX [Escherichia coli]|nr:type-F conjugative transfer system pilin acetylase TraX [Escherichia coli]
MRKNNTAIIFGGLFFSCSVMAGAGTLAPTVVPMVNGGQASIAISNTSPNLFTVPGDRIIAVNSLDGALTNNEQTASGGVVVRGVREDQKNGWLFISSNADTHASLKPRCRRVYCVNHNGSGKLSGKLPGKICCRSVCSRWSGIWFVTCRKRKPWAETDTGRQTLMTTDNTNTRNDLLAARTDTWLQSLLVWSPGQRDIIKTVALVLMVLDHANRILHLDQTWMFLAGRGAFPLFALVWGLNLSRHTHIRQSAINRLWGWGIIAQFAYYLAGFPWYEGNILFAFAVAAQVLTWCETRSLWRTAAAILLMALWGPLSGTSYGIAGLLMLAVSHRLYRAEDRTERLALVACLLAVIPALNLATSDAAAVAGLVMTVLTVGLVSCAGKSLPRFWPGDFFPTFYACHLAVLGVLAL